jgi:hypothetical protein
VYREVFARHVSDILNVIFYPPTSKQKQYDFLPHETTGDVLVP